jgi:outer membrane protein assembly factor BamB
VTPSTTGSKDLLFWTAPNDGNLHSVFTSFLHVVTADETGDQIWVITRDTGANIVASAELSGGGVYAGAYIRTPATVVLRPTETVVLWQYTALTAGFSTIYAEFWAS